MADGGHVVEAAGGVLWRPTDDGPEFAVVHRPKYDDWSLPKGKLDAGETHEQAAVREVREETGFTATLERSLPDVSYDDAKGRPKRVRYWAMRAIDGSFAANDEVDRLQWLPGARARTMLTYDRDRDLLDTLLDDPSWPTS